MTYQYKYYKNWLNDSCKYANKLNRTIPFEQTQVKIFGKLCNERRKTSMHVLDAKINYPYAGTNKDVHPFTMEMIEIANKIEKNFGIKVDICLANLYENGERNIGWHSDDEKTLSFEDGGPHIFSLSFGDAKRKFRFREIGEKAGFCDEMILECGDLVHMQGDCQRRYKHTVPVEKRIKKARINLTFRVSRK